MLRYFCIFLLCTLTFDLSDAVCGTCGATSRVLCRNETVYSYCSGSVGGTLTPMTERHSCPANTICVNAAQFCAPAPATPDCVPACGKCGTNMPFACMSRNSYATCENGTAVGTVITCTPTTDVCVRDTGVCVTQQAGPPLNPASSCGTDETATPAPPTTTPAPTTGPIDPNGLCNTDKRPGRQQLPNECRRFLYCYVTGGVWRGSIFTCPGTTAFNPTLRSCQAGFPCTTP